MILNIFTDPHLGTRRSAHTTPESSKRLTTRLFTAAIEAKHPEYQNVIAGDLFDKTFNSEAVIVQGILVAEGAIVLAGNHDETNREGGISSLDVLAETTGTDIIQSVSVSIPSYTLRNGMAFVPHHASQETFLEALELVMEADASVLFVHCNRGEMPQQDDSTLVITLDLEDRLLSKFKRVFYGHVHGSDSNKVDGDVVESRGVVLGNTHPTSFGDVSNKYRYTYDMDQDFLTRELIWSKDAHYAKVTIGDSIPQGSLEFIEVVGNADRHEVSAYISELWAAHPQAFAIRNNCTLHEQVNVELEEINLEDLPSAIEKELEGSDILDLYKELRSQL